MNNLHYYLPFLSRGRTDPLSEPLFGFRRRIYILTSAEPQAYQLYYRVT